MTTVLLLLTLPTPHLVLPLPPEVHTFNISSKYNSFINSYLHVLTYTAATDTVEKNFYLSQNSQFTDIDFPENIN